MSTPFGGPPARHDARALESTLHYVFGLIWPQACLDCCREGDCYLVGVSEGTVRHIVKVPCGLVEFDQGLTLVRAVYKAGLPRELGGATAPRCVSL